MLFFSLGGMYNWESHIVQIPVSCFIKDYALRRDEIDKNPTSNSVKEVRSESVMTSCDSECGKECEFWHDELSNRHKTVPSSR